MIFLHNIRNKEVVGNFAGTGIACCGNGFLESHRLEDLRFFVLGSRVPVPNL
ncbi:MAG: hypothetical protein K6B46_00390 [Opitutales bacterium]|nr:hypothetical protein [Opitutales bacterium]